MGALLLAHRSRPVTAWPMCLGGISRAITSFADVMVYRSAAAADRLPAELRSGMDTVGQEIRELVYDLRPPTLDELGLAGAVRALAAEGESEVTVETAPATVDRAAA